MQEILICTVTGATIQPRLDYNQVRIASQCELPSGCWNSQLVFHLPLTFSFQFTLLPLITRSQTDVSLSSFKTMPTAVICSGRCFHRVIVFQTNSEPVPSKLYD